jgi:hypothetical protein
MAAPAVSEAEFIELWKTHKSAKRVSEIIGVDQSMVHRRRRSIERRSGIALEAEHPYAKQWEHRQTAHKTPQRLEMGILNGQIIVFSDAHFWPGIRTTAFRALLYFIKKLKPEAVINNGDAFDGASISRHPRIGWDKTPSVIEELKACDAALGEIEEAAKKARHNVFLAWCLGNHDARFESRLAANAPQYQHVNGFSLRDHFPAWRPCWAVWNGLTVIKHRMNGGIHATHNNILKSGVNTVTGHLHSLKVTPFDDYNGTRYGVDTGTLADPQGPQFADYLEQGPTNWRSGFAVLTFKDGRLLWPEVVKVCGDGQVEFRGEVVDVGMLS